MKVLKRIAKQAVCRLPIEVWVDPLYKETRAAIKERREWSPERIWDYQRDQLRVMLKHAGAHVPYYRELFHAAGFDPNHLRYPEDMRRLPTVDKETVRKNPERFIADNIPKSQIIYTTTGGTSGRPLGLYQFRKSGWRERAYIDDQFRRAGFRPGEKRAMLKGAVVHDRSRWTYDCFERAFVFSNFHLTEANAVAYARKMRSCGVKFLHTYPSAAQDFANKLIAAGEEIPSFNAVFVGSENLYAGQKEQLAATYKCRIYNWYGHSENLAMAGFCELNDLYHVFPDYGFVEMLSADGAQVTREGEEAEIVGTSLFNRVMPLIRYRTDDWAVLGPERCACARRWQLWSAVRGRWLQEMLVSRDGHYISMTAINMHTPVFDNVEQLQFHQKEPGHVTLNIVKKPAFGDSDVRQIRSEIEEKIGDGIELDLSIVPEIPLTRAGKFRFVVQEVPVTLSEIHS